MTYAGVPRGPHLKRVHLSSEAVMSSDAKDTSTFLLCIVLILLIIRDTVEIN